MPRPSRREHIINIAIRLFREHGFHSTSIDKIIIEAEVSKKTLYNHFRSKDELILAVLRNYDSIFRNDFVKQVEKLGKTPQGKLLAIFDISEKWFKNKDFYGCLFISAISEYSAAESPFRDICKQFKQLLKTFIQEICIEFDCSTPEALADQIALLLEGAIVTAQVSQSPEAAVTAKEMAKVIIAHELTKN